MLEDGYGCQVQKTLAVAKKTKLKEERTVRTDTLDNICQALQCDISDIMEIVEEGRNEQ